MCRVLGRDCLLSLGGGTGRYLAEPADRIDALSAI